MPVEQSVSRQAGTLIVGRVVAFAFAFALPLVLARIFSQEDFGLYKQLFLIYATLATTLTFGFTASLFYFVPHYAAQRHRYVSQTFLALFILALIGAGALIAFRGQIARVLNDPEIERYIPYLAGITALWLITTFLEPLMIILKQVKLAAATALASEIVRAGLMVAAAALTHNMLVVLLAALVWVGCRVVALLIYLHKIDTPLWTMPDWRRVVEQVRYAFPFGLALIMGTLAVTLHQYVVSHLYSTALFAIYSVGYLQIPIVAIAFESVSDVTLVRLTEFCKSGLLVEATRLIGDSVTKLCMFFLPLYVFLLVSAGDVILLLYTTRYEASIPVFRIFLAEIPMCALTLAYVPRAFADTGFILRVNVLLLVLSALLLGVLAPVGLVGAALASVLANAITKGVILFRVKRLFQVPFGKVLPWRRLGMIMVASMIAGAAASMVHIGDHLKPITRLLISGVVFTLCYGAIAWKAGWIGPDAKRRVTQLLTALSRKRVAERVSNEPITIRTGVRG